MPISYWPEDDRPRCTAVNLVRPGFLGKQCLQVAAHAGPHVNQDGFHWVTDGPSKLPASPPFHPYDPAYAPAPVADPFTRHLDALKGKVIDGKLQAPITSPYRSEDSRVLHEGQIVALAVSEQWAQKLVGGTAADPLWKADAELVRRQAKYWEGRWRQEYDSGTVSTEQHDKVLAQLKDSQDRHERATKRIGRLVREAAENKQLVEARRELRIARCDLEAAHRRAAGDDAAEAQFRAALVTKIKNYEAQGGRTMFGPQAVDRAGLDFHVSQLISKFVQLSQQHAAAQIRQGKKDLWRSEDYVQRTNQLRGKLGLKPSSVPASETDATWTALREAIEHAAERLHNDRELAAELKVTKDLHANQAKTIANQREELAFRDRTVRSQKDAAQQLDRARSQWMARHGELAGAALHLLRRLNALAGERDAEVFTRDDANATVDKVLELRKADTDRIQELEHQLAATAMDRNASGTALVQLRESSQCTAVQRPVFGAPLELRRCIRVNSHKGAHFLENGFSW